MFSAIKRRLTYANAAATLALLFSMTGGALAARHYLVSSIKQINPKVVKQLRGHKGASGANGKTGGPGTAGATGAQGPAGKEGPQGPGASEIVVNLPASTSAGFTKVGSAQGISLEAECLESEITHNVTFNMTYTSATSLSLVQTESESLNGKPTTTNDSAFTIAAASTPEFWLGFEAEKGKTSIQRFDGEYLSPKLIVSESYVATGGPSGKCEAGIGMTPAS
jgi:hypothetical protein